jgi:acetate kinase
MRDLQAESEKGNKRAKLALETYVYNIRKVLGSMMFTLGKVDVVTFAGGTGEAGPYIRKRVLEQLDPYGIVLDGTRNDACFKTESKISTDASTTAVWVVPTNEEILIVRECAKLLAQS